MPRKLKRPKPRLDELSYAQKSHLMCGDYVLPFGDEFEDEDHRRASWQMHRASILEAWDRPGKRPAALWDYDTEAGWEAIAETEEAAVRRLLHLGELEPCRLNGLLVIASEIEAIEHAWRAAIKVALACRERVPPYPGGTGLRGCPIEFYEEHAPRIRAELAAEAARARAVYRAAVNGASG
jgi:hypothetical protein